MNQECEHTRSSLGNYLRGHLFRMRRTRIERHLRACALCRSEFQAMKQAEETRRLLKNISANGGVLSRLREVFSLTRLKTVLYRPLWLAGLALVAATVVASLFISRRLDNELEELAHIAPENAAPMAAPAAAVMSAPAVTVPADVPQPAAAPPVAAPPAVTDAVPAGEPIVIFIVVTHKNEKEAIRRINKALRARPSLGKKQLSDGTREVAGSLAAGGLRTFLKRIDDVGEIRFDRAVVETFPRAQVVPVVLKLVKLPATPDAAAPAEQPAQPSADTVSLPGKTSAPAEAAPSSSPAAAAPSPPTVQ